MTAGRQRVAGEVEATERGRKDGKTRAVAEGEYGSPRSGERSTNLVRSDERNDGLRRRVDVNLKGFPTLEHRWTFPSFHLQNVPHLDPFWLDPIPGMHRVQRKTDAVGFVGGVSTGTSGERCGRGTRTEIGERGGR